MKHLFKGLLAVVTLLVVPIVSNANTIVFSGELASDDDVNFFTFVLPTSGTVTVETLQATTLYPDLQFGQLYGFVPVLTLYDSTGTYYADNYDPLFRGNASINWTTAAGQVWYVALSQWNNQNGTYLPINTPLTSWVASFSQSGNTTYTGDNMGCVRDQFCSGDPFDPNLQRVGHWELSLTSPDGPLGASQVPEPATVYEVIGSLGVLLGLVRVRRNRTLTQQNTTNE